MSVELNTVVGKRIHCYCNMCCVACISASIRYEEIYGEIGITDSLLTIQGIKHPSVAAVLELQGYNTTNAHFIEY